MAFVLRRGYGGMMRMNGHTRTTGGLSRLDLERATVAELERVLRSGVDPSSEDAIGAAAFVGGSIATAIVNLSPRQHRALDRWLKDQSKLAAKIVKILLVDAAQASEGTLQAQGGASLLESPLSEPASERLAPQRNGLTSVLVEEWAGPVAGSTYLEETLRIPRSTLHRWQRRGEVIALLTAGIVYLVVDDSCVPAGTVTLTDNEVDRLFVLPEFQGRGYGRALLDFAEERISEKYDVIILHASLPAKNIYLKRGFREVDYLKIDTGYGDFLCADVMEKKAK